MHQMNTNLLTRLCMNYDNLSKEIFQYTFLYHYICIKTIYKMMAKNI